MSLNDGRKGPRIGEVYTYQRWMDGAGWSWMERNWLRMNKARARIVPRLEDEPASVWVCVVGRVGHSLVWRGEKED